MPGGKNRARSTSDGQRIQAGVQSTMPGGKNRARSTSEGQRIQAGVQQSKTETGRSDPYRVLDVKLDKNELDSPQAGLSGDLPRSHGKKRNITESGLEGEMCGGEMQSLIAGFGTDITKSLVSKRKRLETFTQASLKASNTKVEKVWKAQQTERQRLGEEYNRQSMSVLTQWESDLVKSKETEETLQNMFKQQEKLFQQQRVVQSQRLKTIKQLQDQYMKSMSELDMFHYQQQASIQTELKKEMGLLQKKLLVETQNQEISNVKRSLQSMLDQV